MAQRTVSAELAADHALPGLLGITKDRGRVVVELTLPRNIDHLPKSLLPGVEALVVGYLVRLHRRSRPTEREQVTVTADHLTARLHKDDLPHFLVGLSALLEGAVYWSRTR
ncbi:hypothetical protein [Saccharothrix sp. Mg75]|uniref:hypothetical protein n=1 Tax=Saccharothrix sp. Mg75 TaxID=3445357 RepID=UPI003EEF27DC